MHLEPIAKYRVPTQSGWGTDLKAGKIEEGVLANVAPTLVTFMGIKVTENMTRKVLIV